MTNYQIYYGVKAQVDPPLKPDLVAEQSLVVLEPAGPAPVQVVTQRLTKEFRFDSDSQVEIALDLDKDTFYLGEVLRCRVEVMNRASWKEIRAVTLALRQLETACAQGQTNMAETEIIRVKLEEPRFPPNQRTTVDLELGIPGDLVPTLARGSLVKLDYELWVTLDIPWATDAKLSEIVTLVRAPEQVRLEQATKELDASLSMTVSHWPLRLIGVLGAVVSFGLVGVWGIVGKDPWLILLFIALALPCISLVVLYGQTSMNQRGITQSGLLGRYTLDWDEMRAVVIDKTGLWVVFKGEGKQLVIPAFDVWAGRDKSVMWGVISHEPKRRGIGISRAPAPFAISRNTRVKRS